MCAWRTADVPLGASEGYVSVPGARLYVREAGSGRTLFVLHGGPDFNHHYLLPELDGLACALRLVYYDQRGRGKSSPRVAPESVSIDSEIEDLERLRAHFGLDAIAVLGHSWGGLLAMEYATRHPDRVSHLVLLNTAPASHAELLRFRQQREASAAERLARMRAIAATPAHAAGDIDVEAEYYKLHFGETLPPADQLETMVRRLRAHFTPADIVKARVIEDRLYAQTWLLPDYDLVPRLRALNARMLLIHGERDLIPLAYAERIARAVPGSRLVVLPECGHFSCFERPAAVRDAIVEFFARS